MTQEVVDKIFDQVIEEHGNWIKDYMYMGTYNGEHNFKNIITRRYVYIKENK